MRRRPSVLIFDLDGTLVDSMGPLLDAFCGLLDEQRGVDPNLSRAVAESLMGLNTRGQFSEVLRQAGLPLEGLDELNDLYAVRSGTVTPKPFPEVPAVLRSLQGQGYAMFVSSGARPPLAAKRAALAGIDVFFRLVLGSEDNPERAKGPGHFGVMTEDVGIPAAELAREAWLIGDGTYDMQVAREAGIYAIGRLTGENEAQLRRAGADMVIHDLTQLQGLLDATGRDEAANT